MNNELTNSFLHTLPRQVLGDLPAVLHASNSQKDRVNKDYADVVSLIDKTTTGASKKRPLPNPSGVEGLDGSDVINLVIDDGVPKKRARKHQELATITACFTDQHRHELATRGWTVVENIIDMETCNVLKKEWLDTMESYGTGFKADDPTTWLPSTVPPNLRGMQSWPPVQERFVWEARLATAPVFAKIWDCAPKNLLTSMDRVCFVPPSRLHNKQSWWHLDQTNTDLRGRFACVQGFVTLEDIGEGEVALEVMEGANPHHGTFFSEHLDPQRAAKCTTGNWHKFEPKDTAWYLSRPGVAVKRVHAPAGSLVLWDSRLPHHAGPPADPSKRSQKTRFVIYTCMMPREEASDKTIAKRLEAYEQGRAMSHWPNAPKLFAKKPRTYGKELPCADFDIPAMVARAQKRVSDWPLMRRLIGY